MKRKLGAVLFVIYAIIAITVTVLLLSYNEYNCSEIGSYTVFIVNDDTLEPDYKQGSILLIKKSSDKNIEVGDELFLYNVINSQEFEVVNRTLEFKKQQGRHIMYDVNGEESYASDYCIGKASNTIVIEGWGTLLAILESKWGYLFCIVIVSLLLFLQEVFDLIMEIKYGGGSTTKKSKNTKTTKNVQSTKRTSTAKTSQQEPKAQTSQNVVNEETKKIEEPVVENTSAEEVSNNNK